MDKNLKDNKTKLESFYRHKISTLIQLIKDFKAKKEKEGISDYEIIMTDELRKFLVSKIILHLKYYNKQVISFKYAETALRKLNYSEIQVISTLSLIDLDKLNIKYSSQAIETGSFAQISLTEINSIKKLKYLKFNFKAWKKKNPPKPL